MLWIHALKRILPREVLAIRKIYTATRPIAKRKCNICDFYGWFGNFGRPPRQDAQCPRCFSLERHRLFYLAYKKGLLSIGDKIIEPILHFAPERILEKVLRDVTVEYKTADLFAPADLKLNIESLDIVDNSIGTAIANHVLEHVDDRKALQEIFRVLKPGGVFIASTPIVEGWEHTYENSEVISERDRLLHFGQGDHVRYYGRDFRDRVHGAGFRTEREVTSEGKDVIDFGLLRGEKIFVFRK